MTMVSTLPTTFYQYAEEGGESVHIQWNEEQFNSQVKIGTQGVLSHLARSPKTDLRNKTYYLKVQGFNFYSIPNSINGIEVVLTTDRRGRVTDETVQLVINDQIVGENKANLDLDPIKTYGGIDDLWGLENLGQQDIDSNFGILMRFQSHPHFPHRDGMFIRGIEVRIH